MNIGTMGLPRRSQFPSHFSPPRGGKQRPWIDKARDFASIKDFRGSRHDEAVRINRAIKAVGESGGGTVYVPPGLYLTRSPIYMLPNVELFGHKRSSVIKQADAANLEQMIDFTPYFGGVTATGASLRGLQIDGNRDNNLGLFLAGGAFRRAIYYGNTNLVTIDDCLIYGSNGYGIHGASCFGMTVSRNSISDCELHRFFLVHTSGGFDADVSVYDNDFDGDILIGGVNNVSITDNCFAAHLIGYNADPMVVDINGTAVTWVSGPNFATARSGQLFIANQGTVQITIAQVNSSTSLTLSSTGGIVSGVPAMIGEQDLLSVAGCKRFVVDSNIVRNGASFGISLSGLFAQIEDGVVSNNSCYFQGITGLALLGDGGGLGGTGGNNISIVGNSVVDAIQGNLAGSPAGAGSRHSYVIKGSTLTNVLVDANLAVDRAGLTHSWLGVDGLAVGSVAVGSDNQQIGAQNAGISGGIPSVTLDPAWGNTAAVSAVISHGHAHELVVTANGTGIGANPAVTINTVAHKLGQPNPVYHAKMVGGTGALAQTYDENFSSKNSAVFRYNGTPVAGQTYRFHVI